MGPDDPGRDRAGVDADPKGETMALDPVPRDVIADPERQIGDGVRMVGPGSRDPGGDHIGIAHRLDLLQPELGDEPVERREDLIQQTHQFGR